MIEKLLLSIGLSEKEVRVYLTSLEFGSQPASVIAAHTDINRTTVYDTFADLIQKGLANKMKKSGTTYFQVMDPRNLIQYLEREKNERVRQLEKQKEQIAAIIPALHSLENPLSTKPKVQFFEGEKGMREAYEDTLTTQQGPIRAYANVDECMGGLPNFFPDYFKRRAKADIPIQAIFPDTPLAYERMRCDLEEMRETRLIDKKYSFSPELNVYDDKIMIASWKEKMAIIIKSQEIAELLKKMFDLVWEKLNKERGKLKK